MLYGIVFLINSLYMETKNTQSLRKVSELLVQTLPWFIGAIALLSIFFTKPSEGLTVIIVGFFTLVSMMSYLVRDVVEFLDRWFEIASNEKGYRKIPHPIRVYVVIAIGVMVISQTLLAIIRGVVHEGLDYVPIHYLLIPFVITGFCVVYFGLRSEAYFKVTEKWILKAQEPEDQDFAV